MKLGPFEHPGWAMAAVVILFSVTGAIIYHFNLRLKRRWVKFGFAGFWFLMGLLLLTVLMVQYTHVFWEVDFPSNELVVIKRLPPLKPVELQRSHVRVIIIDPLGAVISNFAVDKKDKRLIIKTISGCFYKSLPSLEADRLREIAAKIKPFDPEEPGYGGK